MGHRLLSLVMTIAAIGAAGGCGQGFTLAGSDGGAADRSAPDGPADIRAADVPGDGGTAPDAACVAPDGALGAMCVPAIGEIVGWEFVSYERNSMSSTCPAGYDSGSAVVEAGGPATCGCTCTAPTVSCSGGHVDYGVISASVDAGLSSCATTGTFAAPTGCTKLTTVLPPSSSVQVGPIVAMTGGCTAMPEKSVPAEVPGLVCKAILGTGCGRARACLPEPVSALICGMHSGEMACPKLPGVTFQRFVVAPATAPFASSRDCTSCNCGVLPPMPGNCTGSLNLFTDTMCTSSPSFSVGADGKCLPVGNKTATIGSVKFSLTPPATSPCPPSSSTPTGSETSTAPLTVCCLL